MTIIGLGPGDDDLLTVSTLNAIQAISTQFIRTTRHPAARAMPCATSFDHHYEASDRFDQVYAAIVDDLVSAALVAQAARVVYAVPGSPTVAERTVVLLREHPAVVDGRVTLTVHPSVSFLDLAFATLGVDR